jgi:lipid-A-disaccharide synthase
MVVGYRVHPFTYQLLTQLRLVKVQYAAMANLLAGRELAPEFLQDRCRADLLAPAILALLDDPARVAAITAEYARIHAGMRHDAARAAALAVLELIGRAPG